MESQSENRLGIELKVLDRETVALERRTLESLIQVRVEDAPRRPYAIDTGIKFFNHMVMGLASRACLNVDVSYQPTVAETLDHVIIEDTGLALGRAIRELLDARIAAGVNGRGTYTVTFDEALVAATVAFDGRAYTFIHGSVPALAHEHVEDVLASTLRQFFDGFAQGAGAVVQLQFFAGDDPHHAWEAAFKALGEALRDALAPCPYRAGTTIGLKGTGREK
jgi:imidazoleglycerol-phosphate dehydratase